jgi:hypothetical protein
LTTILQKERELRFLKHFLELLPDCPVGDIENNNTERPDFYLNTNLGLVGIEITELIPCKFDEDKHDLQRSSIENEILSICNQYYKKQSNINICAYITFNYKIICSKTKKELFAKQIVSSVVDVINKINPDHYCQINIDNNTLLPTFIENILLIFHPTLTASIWNSGHGSLIRNPDIIEIQGRITSKEILIPNYTKPSNEKWLLIVEPFDHSCYDDFSSIKSKYWESTFNRVFVLRSLLNEYFELNVN